MQVEPAVFDAGFERNKSRKTPKILARVTEHLLRWGIIADDQILRHGENQGFDFRYIKFESSIRCPSGDDK